MGGISVLFILGIFLSLYVLFWIAIIGIILYLLINYTFEGIFLYKVSKNRNYKFSILSWLPCYNKIILGKIANKNKQGYVLSIIDFLKFFLIISICILAHITGQISYIFIIATIMLLFISFIMKIYLSHNIFKKVTNKFADVLTILNIFTLGLSRTIILFAIRNNNKLI